MNTKAVLVSWLLLVTLTLSAQTEKMQSAFVYNIISKYIEWPESYKGGDFVMGVLGDSPILKEFKMLAKSRTIGSQNISVVKFNSVDEITKCHLIFISKANLADLENVVARIGNTIVVADGATDNKKGITINFVMVNNKQRYELKPNYAVSKGLKVSPEIANMTAEKVYTAEN
jgi:hypothetical protein